MSPTQRTLQWLREAGYTAQVVERFEPHSRRRVDLFQCIDIVAVNELRTVGVQATSASGMSARLAKIKTLPGARAWVETAHLVDNRRALWVVGWRKFKKAEDGKFWRCIAREVTLADLEGESEPWPTPPSLDTASSAAPSGARCSTGSRREKP